MDFLQYPSQVNQTTLASYRGLSMNQGHPVDVIH